MQKQLADRCFLFEKFVDEAWARAPQPARFLKRNESVAIHAHCHAKSLLNTSFMTELAEKLPGTPRDCPRHWVLRNGGNVRDDEIETRFVTRSGCSLTR